MPERHLMENNPSAINLLTNIDDEDQLPQGRQPAQTLQPETYSTEKGIPSREMKSHSALEKSVEKSYSSSIAKGQESVENRA